MATQCVVRRIVRALFALVLGVGMVAPVLVVSTSTPVGAQGPVGFTLLYAGSVTINDQSGTDVAIQQPSPCQLARVDLASGALTPLAHVGLDACVTDLAMTPDGSVYGIASPEANKVHLYGFDTSTGQPTDLGQIDGSGALGGAPTGAGGITFDADGTMFVEMEGAPVCESWCLYRGDPADPASVTLVGPGEPGPTYQVLAAGCDLAATLRFPAPGGTGSTNRGDVGAEAFPTPGLPLVSRDLSNGEVAPIGGTGADNALTGLAFDSHGTLWGVGWLLGDPNTQQVFTLDTATGAASPVVPLGNGDFSEGLAFGLALPLDCSPPQPPPMPPPSPPTPVVLAPRFTG